MIDSFPFLPVNEQGILLTWSNGLLTSSQRGLVPVLQYTPASTPETTHTLTESSLIITFLTSLHPSHLTPAHPPTVQDTHRQYLTSFLTDTYFNKVNPLMFKLVGAATPAAKTQVVDSILDHLKTEIEPFLARHLSPTFLTTTTTTTTDDAGDATPNLPQPPPSYFLASSRPTLAEIHIIPISMRLLEFSNGTILPQTLRERIQAETPVFYAWSNRSMANPNIWEYWGDSAYWIARIEERLPRAQAKYADA